VPVGSQSVGDYTKGIGDRISRKLAADLPDTEDCAREMPAEQRGPIRHSPVLPRALSVSLFEMAEVK